MMAEDQTPLASKFCCKECGKDLSRKQRLKTHLASVHGIKVDKQTRYRQYLVDPSFPVPRRTLNRLKAKEKTLCTETNMDISQALPNLPTTSKTLDTNEESFENLYLATDESCLNDDTLTVNVLGAERLSDHNESHESVLGENKSDNECDDSNSETDSEWYFSDTSDCEFEVMEEKNNKVGTRNEEIHLTVLSYMLKYNLNGQASRDLVDMINCISEENNLKEVSMNSVRSSIETSDVVIKDYCEKCFSLFPEDESIYKCINSACSGLRYKGTEHQQNQLRRKSFFTCLSPGQQILDILKRDGIWKSLKEYKTTSKLTNEITDITTGLLYRKLCKDENFLSNENNLTLLFNTDGIPLYKSSGVSIWPLYLVINELPPKMRFSKKNMILWGVWQGKGKPVFHTFLQPFIQEMQQLKTEGFMLETNNQIVCVKAMLIAGTMDLQAKAYVTDMTQHNGKHGCLTCKHPGEVVAKGKGHARAYGPGAYTRRTSEGLIQNAQKASTDKPEKGIKGVSILLGLEWFNVIDGLGPDYMHGVLLGVAKKMLQLLFSASYSKEPFSVASQIKTVDKRLKNMKPTDDIGRLPRSLEQNMHHLKASEVQNWLLFYAIPCLTGFLPKKYLDHLALLIEGIYLLLGDNITDYKMQRSELVLSEFYNTFLQLYGLENCTLNLHNVCLHLPEYVKLLGPLWAWSCFPFEDMNGSILNCVHGTGDVCLQVLWFTQAHKRLAIDSNNISDMQMKEFRDKMASTKRRVNVTRETKNCKVVGGSFPKEISNDLQKKINQALLVNEDERNIEKVTFVSRILMNNTVFYSKDYQRHSKRICHYVLLQNNEETCVAVVDHFLYHQDKNVCLAVIRQVSLDENETLAHPYVHHLLRVKNEQLSEVEVVMADQIQEKLIFINGNRLLQCVSRLPNLHGLCC